VRNIDNIFSDITNKILNYEDGDVMTISDIIDLLTETKNLPDTNENTLEIIGSLINIANDNLKNGKNKDFAIKLTEGIDIIQKNMRDKSNNKKGTDEKSKEFIEKNSEKKPETTEIINEPTKVVVDDLISNFIIEAEERIATAQELILKLETSPKNMDLINELFRIFHTIKGECGFLKFASFGKLTHNIENILDLLKNNKLEINPEIIDNLLEGVDISKLIIKELKEGNVFIYNQTKFETYINNLENLKNAAQPHLGDILVKNGKLSELAVEEILTIQKETAYTKKFGEVAVENQYLTETDIKDVLEKQKNTKPIDESKIETIKKAELSEQIIKVKSSKVNYIVDMIGELLISIGQINDSSPAFTQMKKITKILQYAAMQLRTDKVKNLLGNTKRVVRDVAKKCNKNIEVEIFGEELEIDRNLIEKLEEPLMHLVRNSVDHGIEPEANRIQKNKPAAGTVKIGAERRGNNIIISVADDGQGLNKDKIIKKAVEKNLIKETDISTMTDNQIYNLIFVNGFSTAETVDYVSGRGIGMDIVQSVVSTNKGKIEIQTKKDQFTSFNLIFPLSTAIIDGMVVNIEDNNYIIPIASIIQSLKIKPEMIFTVNESIEVIKIREEVIPIINLKEIFEIPQVTGTNTIGIIVENSSSKKFIILVDEIIAKREVVIKSLGKKFKKLKGISSGTVLSGGKVGLVLDIDQIVDISQNMAVNR
jgi:two-component system, chemotaxis family, sensor kinase CheA